MDTRHLVESPLAAAPAAAAETLGTPVPATLGTRRDFCVTACQALSLGAIAATLQACGGGSNPNEPSDEFSNVPSLPSIPATVANGVATLNVAGTALANNGGTAIVNDLARHDARRAQRHGLGVGIHGDLHPSAVGRSPASPKASSSVRATDAYDTNNGAVIVVRRRRTSAASTPRLPTS